MKKSLFISIFLFLAIFSVATRVNAQIPEVVINEIQIEGKTEEENTIDDKDPLIVNLKNNDFIELYNTTNRPIDISGWKLKKTTQGGTESKIITFSFKGYGVIVPANGYLLWSHEDYNPKDLTLKQFTSKEILSNNYSIGLFNKNDNLIDALTYGSGHKKIYNPSITYQSNPSASESLERDLEKNIFNLQKNPSPQNNAFLVKVTPKQLPLRINEVFPNPAAKGEDNEYIEIYNFGDKNIDLTGFTLKDATQSGGYVFPAETEIKPGEFLLIYKSVSKISLNNTEEQIYLLDDNENQIDFLEYFKTKEESTFGFDEVENTFRWSKNLTPGAKNIFDPAPSGKSKIPKKSYKNFPTEFSASGSTDYDYSWDFGDGSRSTKQKISHTYKKTGKYKGFLIIDNGVEEKKIDFEIKIEKYPKRSLDIIAVLPNPEGTDEDNEYIIIKNNDKKEIDLSDWSIATGSKKDKLTNHPFTKSITLKKGEEKIIYNKHSNFSLPNQKGYIELRQPDGKTSDKVSYAKEKTIGENELYKLTGEKNWNWINQPLLDKTEELDKKEEIKFEDLSEEEKEKITATIKESLRQEIFQELEASYTSTSEKNPEVKGQFESSIAEENNNNSLPNKIKKSLKNTYLQFGRLFEKLWN
ncbi:MAG: PKD domain-containing protein [Candidatus Moranbacteria bacterium]|nr:PKD domain-containing protein [Candidatus Moranbacteria bacterium]